MLGILSAGIPCFAKNKQKRLQLPSLNVAVKIKFFKIINFYLKVTNIPEVVINVHFSYFLFTYHLEEIHKNRLNVD